MNEAVVEDEDGTARLLVPRLTEDMTEAGVTDVLVSVGAQVTAGSSIVVLETEKVEVELSSPVSGKVTAVHVEPGATVRIGETLCEIQRG